MKSRIVLLLCTSVAVLASCSESVGPVPQVGAYYPMTKGSVWTYNFKGPGGGLNYTVTAMSDSLIDGNLYTLMNNSFSGISGVRFADGVYYAFDPTSETHWPFLKESAVGDTWSDEFTVSGQRNRQEYIMMAKGVSKEVRGRMFTDVIQVHTSLAALRSATGAWEVYNESDDYYARGIGLVLSDFGNGEGIDLVDYDIK